MEGDSIILAMNPRATFLQYDGNHEQMHRDGLLHAYKACKVSQLQERIWAEELQFQLLEKIKISKYVDTEFYRLISLIKRFDLQQGLLQLAVIVGNLKCDSDVFTRLLAVECIINAIEGRFEYINNSNKSEILDLLIPVIKELVKCESLIIPEFYLKRFAIPGAICAEEVKRRIQELRKYEK